MNLKLKEQKDALRAEIKKLKKEISIEEKLKKSHALFALIENEDFFINARTILAYWSLPDEVCTHEFIQKWSVTKQFLLPCVNNDDLIIRKFENKNSLVDDNTFGIGEPIGEEFLDYQKIDLVLVPGVAFDKDNNRMGRGKAYYDRFLLKTPAQRVGLCFKFQFVENVPHDSRDLKVDKVICG